MGRAIFAMVVGGGLVVAAGAGARAEDLLVPEQFRTLQEAVDAAAPGDRVVVGPGRYRGGATITTPGVAIEGDGAVLRGRRGERTIGALADGVAVRGLRMRGGGVLAIGNDIVIERNRFERVRDIPAVEIEGDGAIVRINEVDRARESTGLSGIDGAIAIVGNDATVTGNTVSGVVATDGVSVLGTGADVTGNAVDFVAAGFGIRVQGDACGVVGNRCTNVGRTAKTTAWTGGNFADPMVGGGGGGGGPRRVRVLRSCPGIGVYNDRGGALVVGNSVEHVTSDGYELVLHGGLVSDNAETYVGAPGGMGAGILLAGTGNVVEENLLEGGSIDATRMEWTKWSRFEDGGGNVVARNEIRSQSTGGTALVLRGEGNTAADNRVNGCDAGGVLVDGSGNLLSGNSVRWGEGEFADGFVVAGDGNVLSGNECSSMPRTGFVLLPGATGNVVTDCTSRWNDGCGIDNCALDTVVTGSTFEGNRVIDVLNRGGLAGFDGNRFDTGGPVLNLDLDVDFWMGGD